MVLDATAAGVTGGCAAPDVVLGIELQSSGREVHALDCCAMSPATLGREFGDSAGCGPALLTSLHGQDKQDPRRKDLWGPPFRTALLTY